MDATSITGLVIAVIIGIIIIKVFFRFLTSLILLVGVGAGLYVDYTLYQEDPNDSYIIQYVIGDMDVGEMTKSLKENVRETIVDEIKDDIVDDILYSDQ